MKQIIQQELTAHQQTAKAMEAVTGAIEVAAKLCIDALKNGGKILLFGNGGSAADAQHIAAELVGRYKVERKGLPAIALTTDSSAITCISNDYDYKYVFSRQIEALAKKNDVAIGISTGGSSINVINGLLAAKEARCTTIGFSGKTGGDFGKVCDTNIIVPSKDTARIQEMHIFIGHTICHLIDSTFANKQL